MKEDVLKDLPPKITQDYYCQLSPIQQLLYEDFAKEQKDKNKNDKSHIFAALQYLRKVCNHPKLVLQNSDHKHYNLVQKLLAESNSNLNALRQVWDHPYIMSAIGLWLGSERSNFQKELSSPGKIDIIQSLNF